MCKKIISFIVAVIVVAIFLTATFVFAYENYDAIAASAGYVARIGDAESAYANGAFTGYYKFLDSTFSVGYSSEYTAALDAVAKGQTVTLISDVDMRAKSGNINITTKMNNITIKGAEGRDVTLYSTCCFVVDGKILNMEDLTVSVEQDSACFAVVKSSGTVNFKNCTFVSSSTPTYGLFHVLSSTLNITGGSINFGEYDTDTNTYSGVDAKAGSNQRETIIWSNSTGSKVNLNGVYADISNSSELYGISLEKGGTVGIVDSTLITGDHSVFLGRADGKYSQSVSVTSSTIKSLGTASEADGIAVYCKNAATVSIDVNGASDICAQKGEGLKICGEGSIDTCRINIGESSCVSSASSDGIDISDATGSAQPVSIAINDKAKVSSAAEGGCALMIGDVSVTLDMNGEASLNADIPYSLSAENLDSVITAEDTVSVATIAPTVSYGASIRIQEGSNGIRFSTTVDGERVANAKDHGILLVKYSDLIAKEADFTVHSMDSENVTYGKISAKDDSGSGVYEDEDGSISFTVVLTDLPTEELTTKFAVRAYALYTVNGTDVYVYSDFLADENVRSMANVAYSALNDVKESKDEAGGYIYEVETGKWSLYTKTQYNIIKTTYGDVAEPKA